MWLFGAARSPVSLLLLPLPLDAEMMGPFMVVGRSNYG